MSKITDNNLSIEFRKKLIKDNISIDTCKECIHAQIKNNELICTLEIPEVVSCNLLKIFYITT